jgi:23S rRNA (guanosine2251-2'-O)-methyltransferase
MRIVAILDNIRSVHNVGSIFRTADAAGVAKIYCCGITPGPRDRFKKIRADFAKVALGAEKSVEWEMAQNTEDTIVQLKKDGWKVFAIEQAVNSVPYNSIRKSYILNRKSCLVVGNEVSGLSESVLKLSDAILEIPMRGKKESLNVAVAFGIVVFHLTSN